MRLTTYAISLALLLSLLPSAQADELKVNTPIDVVVCQPAVLSWSGGQPPYSLEIVAPGWLTEGHNYNSTYLLWVATIPPDLSAVFTISDSTGARTTSKRFEILSAADTSCVRTGFTTAFPTLSEPTASASDTTSEAVSSKLSNGATVGIAVGVGLLGTVASGSLVLLWVRRRYYGSRKGQSVDLLDDSITPSRWRSLTTTGTSHMRRLVGSPRGESGSMPEFLGPVTPLPFAPEDPAFGTRRLRLEKLNPPVYHEPLEALHGVDSGLRLGGEVQPESIDSRSDAHTVSTTLPPPYSSIARNV